VNCGVTELFTTTLIVAFDAHCPNVGVKVYVVVPTADVLIGADHVPEMPLLDVLERDGAAAFWQSGETCVKTGATGLFTVMTIVEFDAQSPDVGVNVYVVVPAVDVLIGADHVPETPLLEVKGNVGAVAF